MKKTYKSQATATVHQMMEDLHSFGHIDKRTMRDFDELCLEPIEPLSGEQIRNIREHEQVSQGVFAHYFNVSKDTVSKWECGKKEPKGSSLKLLFLVKRKGLAYIA